jgi:hypothetical protein
VPRYRASRLLRYLVGIFETGILELEYSKAFGPICMATYVPDPDVYSINPLDI